MSQYPRRTLPPESVSIRTTGRQLVAAAP